MSLVKESDKTKKTAKDPLKKYEEDLKSGYLEMSRINLSLAEEAVQSDNDSLLLAEQILRSVKKSDS